MIDRKILFTELCELLNDKKLSEDDLYVKLYDDLEAAGCCDHNYLKHLDDIEAKYSLGKEAHGFIDAVPHIKDLSFNECCTLLTFLFRAERWAGGWFETYLNDGTIYKLLSRARDTAS